jgi:hypothetical protein
MRRRPSARSSLIKSSFDECKFLSRSRVELFDPPPVLIGVLLFEIECLISSNFLATDVAALRMLLIPPWIISFDFFPVSEGLRER